ncbi:hypothetical protein ACIP79_19755 [Streptomyces sp. NPDC088747]|uniref:hypothetical protein n=1 Tax=Streptomyces sp. NPDC088747 TaxID=3365886 RepID=UPI0037FFA987
MDPATIAVVGAAVGGFLLRVCCPWFTARAVVRRVEAEQRGLLERIRSLPPGSRLTERSAGREVDVVVGAPAAGGVQGR